VRQDVRPLTRGPVVPARPRFDRATAVVTVATLAALGVLALALQPRDVGTPAVAEGAAGVLPSSPAPTVAGAVVEDPTTAPSPLAPDVSAPPAAPVVDPDVTVTLAFGGDVHGERQIASALAAGEDLLGEVAPFLSGADLAMVNLETPVGSSGTAAAKTYTFQAPRVLLSALAGAGVDVVSVANNHTLDQGLAGLRETLVNTGSAGLVSVGAGETATAAYAPAVFDLRGIRVAVVGLSRVFPRPDWAATDERPGLASGYDTARAVDAVRAARDVADHVVVLVHWGTERAACPDTSQVDLAEALHAAGARVVVGAHPHVWQGLARPRADQLTAFSLGNFVWYAGSEDTGRTGVLTVTLDRQGVTDVAVHPFRVAPDGAPRATTDADAAALDRVLHERVPGVSCPVAGIPRD
jgi:poly-gamma-glutamate capsule biosynthesis protein CapA/YwtB (metallophosphatase superfamily)